MTCNPETIAIYSVGLLGGSLGLGLKQSGFKGKIIGLSSESSLQKALALGCIDEGFGYEHLEEVAKRSDILFLCSPINAIIETITRLGKCNLPNNLIVTDVGSTKDEIVRKASELPSQVYFIGGHPMAGSEKSGPSASDPFLFQNAIYVLTPLKGTVSDKEKWFASFLEKHLGCRTLFLDPSVHDSIAATVSHVPHLLAVALVHLARNSEEQIPGTLTLAAGGFRDMTRIASSSYPMWHDIFLTNKCAIESQLDQYIHILTGIKLSLQNDSLGEYFSKSHETRSRIPSANKGFIRPLSEILVHAKDQPGFIAALSKVLFDKNINIKDIEVMKVREGEGGTIRLAFETATIARDAITALAEHGFTSRERT